MNESKIKKVLIALDYDENAQKVAERGFSMAKAMEAEVILLHVISNPVYYYSSYMAIATTLIKTESELKNVTKEFLEGIKNKLGDASIQVIVKEGVTAETIMDTAKETDSDMIVVGTHGRKWLENILIGSVAEKVVHVSTLPLIVIPIRPVKL